MTLSTAPLSRSEAAPADAPAPAPHISFVHLLRGLAALLVMWAHLSGFWLYANQRGWVVQDVWARYVVVPFHLFQNAGHLGVVLFFLISGYIITHASRRESPAQFFVKRALRIFPLLAASIALTALVVTIARTYDLGDLPGVAGGGWLDYLKAAFLLDQFTGSGYVLGATWTLAIEVVFYVLVGISVASKRRSPLGTTWLMIGFWAVATPVVLSTPALSYLATTLVYLAFLFAGRLVYLWQRELAPVAPVVSALCVVALLYVLFYTVAFPGQLLTPSVEPLVSYLIAVVVFAALLLAPIQRVAQPFRFLGDASYSIYLLHLPIGMLSLAVVTRAGLPFTVAFLVAVTATLLMSWLSYSWVEKPFQRLARRISTRIGSSPTGRRRA